VSVNTNRCEIPVRKIYSGIDFIQIASKGSQPFQMAADASGVG